jgi:hypothetical protein
MEIVNRALFFWRLNLKPRMAVPTQNFGWDNLPVTLGIPDFRECWVTRPRYKSDLDGLS